MFESFHALALIAWFFLQEVSPQVSLTVAFSSSAFFGLLFLIFLSYGVQVWWVCWSVKHTNTMVI